MAGMKEIAERAGVSIATVSHVFNQTRPVNAQTAERVLKIARELGYAAEPVRKMPRAQGPRHADMLGLIVSDIQNPFFAETIKGFQDQALFHDQEPIVMNTAYDPLRTLGCVKRLARLGVPGVGVLASERVSEVCPILLNERICGVYLDGGSAGPYIGSLRIDYGAGIRQAIDYLRGMGHEQIGYIGSQLSLEGLRQRREAFVESLTDDGLAAQRIIETDWTVEGGHYAASKLFARFRPTAIICSNDQLAIGVLHYAFDQGIDVPGKLSVVGFDNISFARFTMPELTTVNVPKTELGRQACDLLREMIEDDAHSGREVVLQPQLVVRQSTGPAGA